MAGNGTWEGAMKSFAACRSLRMAAAPRRLVRALGIALALGLPMLPLGGGTAAADSFAFSYSSGGWGHRHHHHYRPRHFHHRPRGIVVLGPSYYYPPPAVLVPRTVYVKRPVVTAYAPSCTSGLWRQNDGSMVEGVACRQADGSWRLE